ncbi:hypothetical protein ATKI12_6706 [Kitasatospora sp. Ki12]
MHAVGPPDVWGFRRCGGPDGPWGAGPGAVGARGRVTRADGRARTRRVTGPGHVTTEQIGLDQYAPSRVSVRRAVPGPGRGGR